MVNDRAEVFSRWASRVRVRLSPDLPINPLLGTGRIAVLVQPQGVRSGQHTAGISDCDEEKSGCPGALAVGELIALRTPPSSFE